MCFLVEPSLRKPKHRQHSSHVCRPHLDSSQNPKFRLPVRTDDANQNPETSHENPETSHENPETSHESSTDFLRAVLEAEKMIARFGLLSWTLCFNTMSPIFRQEFGTFAKLKDKGLLQAWEEKELKVGMCITDYHGD